MPFDVTGDPTGQESMAHEAAAAAISHMLQHPDPIPEVGSSSNSSSSSSGASVLTHASAYQPLNTPQAVTPVGALAAHVTVMSTQLNSGQSPVAPTSPFSGCAGTAGHIPYNPFGPYNPFAQQPSLTHGPGTVFPPESPTTCTQPTGPPTLNGIPTITTTTTIATTSTQLPPYGPLRLAISFKPDPIHKPVPADGGSLVQAAPTVQRNPPASAGPTPTYTPLRRAPPPPPPPMVPNRQHHHHQQQQLSPVAPAPASAPSALSHVSSSAHAGPCAWIFSRETASHGRPHPDLTPPATTTIATATAPIPSVSASMLEVPVPQPIILTPPGSALDNPTSVPESAPFQATTEDHQSPQPGATNTTASSSSSSAGRGLPLPPAGLSVALTGTATATGTSEGVGTAPCAFAPFGHLLASVLSARASATGGGSQGTAAGPAVSATESGAPWFSDGLLLRPPAAAAAAAAGTPSVPQPQPSPPQPALPQPPPQPSSRLLSPLLRVQKQQQQFPQYLHHPQQQKQHQQRQEVRQQTEHQQQQTEKVSQVLDSGEMLLRSHVDFLLEMVGGRADMATCRDVLVQVGGDMERASHIMVEMYCGAGGGGGGAAGSIGGDAVPESSKGAAGGAGSARPFDDPFVSSRPIPANSAAAAAAADGGSVADVDTGFFGAAATAAATAATSSTSPVETYEAYGYFDGQAGQSPPLPSAPQHQEEQQREHGWGTPWDEQDQPSAGTRGVDGAVGRDAAGPTAFPPSAAAAAAVTDAATDAIGTWEDCKSADPWATAATWNPYGVCGTAVDGGGGSGGALDAGGGGLSLARESHSEAAAAATAVAVEVEVNVVALPPLGSVFGEEAAAGADMIWQLQQEQQRQLGPIGDLDEDEEGEQQGEESVAAAEGMEELRIYFPALDDATLRTHLDFFNGDVQMALQLLSELHEEEIYHRIEMERQAESDAKLARTLAEEAGSPDGAPSSAAEDFLMRARPAEDFDSQVHSHLAVSTCGVGASGAGTAGGGGGGTAADDGGGSGGVLLLRSPREHWGAKLLVYIFGEEVDEELLVEVLENQGGNVEVARDVLRSMGLVEKQHHHHHHHHQQQTQHPQHTRWQGERTVPGPATDNLGVWRDDAAAAAAAAAPVAAAADYPPSSSPPSVAAAAAAAAAEEDPVATSLVSRRGPPLEPSGGGGGGGGSGLTAGAPSSASFSGSRSEAGPSCNSNAAGCQQQHQPPGPIRQLAALGVDYQAMGLSAEALQCIRVAFDNSPLRPLLQGIGANSTQVLEQSPPGTLPPNNRSLTHEDKQAMWAQHRELPLALKGMQAVLRKGARAACEAPGSKRLGTELLRAASALDGVIREQHHKASAHIYANMNAALRQQWKTDLHAQLPAEVAVHLDRVFRNLQGMGGNVDWLIITGKGLHSRGDGPKLPAIVNEWIAARGLDGVPQPGAILVRLTPQLFAGVGTEAGA